MFYDNVATWVDFNSGEIHGNTPADKYKGWRILSVDSDAGVVRLVSSGVPLVYCHGSDAIASLSNLTTGFLDTPINSTRTIGTFYECGFKTAVENGTNITDITSLKNLFDNDFTALSSDGRGNPAVQALSLNDVLAVSGPYHSYYYIYDWDLLAVPCSEPRSGGYAPLLLATRYASSGNTHTMWGTTSAGGLDYWCYNRICRCTSRGHACGRGGF